MNNGKVAGKGTHQELLKDCEVYREIAKSQLSEEEFERELATSVSEKGVSEGVALKGDFSKDGNGKEVRNA